MFGLQQLFAALRRLTEQVNRAADVFEQANQVLEVRLAVTDEATTEPQAIEYNGKGRKAKV